METFDDLTARHDREAKELADQVKVMLKAAKKSHKAELEAKAIQMGFDLKAKHRDEVDEWEAATGSDAPMQVHKPVAEPEPALSDADIAEAKRAKAKKKHDKRDIKEKVREEMKKEIQASSAGQSQRENETSIIAALLTKEGLLIKPILSDGHCLYRSISDQLHLNPRPPTSPILGFQQLRERTAAHLRAHAADYAPFLGLDADSIEFAAYCDNIVNQQLAEWGGQIEIQALCESLQRKIHVYSADAPLLRMGEDTVASDAPPLRISYHKHYYALGEHYNSVIPVEDAEDFAMQGKHK